MAYAAAISLKQAIRGLLNSSRICIDSSSREILGIAFQELESLQEVLRKSDEFRSRENLNTLDGEIRDSLHKLQDSLETQASEQFLSILGEEEVYSSNLPLELDLKEVHHEFNSFTDAVKEMEEAYNQYLDKLSSEDDNTDDNAATSQTNDSSNVKMIGLSDVFTELKDHLMRIIRPDEFGFFSFFGSLGSGRSILAKSVYEDIHVNKQGSFDCGAWVTIGSTYTLKEILLNIISQISGIEDLEFRISLMEEELGNHLYKNLEGSRYIISLDDIRNTEILIQLRRSFPVENNGSLVFVTTDLIEVAEFDESFTVYTMPTTMDEHFVWDYIRSVHFEENEPISPEFEEIGRKIAKNCRGHRLVVARIMLILRKMKRVPENWGGLAAAERDRVYQVYDEISEANDVEKYLGEDDREVWAKGLFDFSILIARVKENLYPERLFPNMLIVTLYGMAGVGKTTLMKKLFGDPSILRRFDHCVWVNVGSRYKSEDIVIDTLVQIYPHIDKRAMKEDEKLLQVLLTQLSYKKCLIALDDLWSQEPVHFLKKFLPNIMGVLTITTRLTIKVGYFGTWDWARKIRLLNKDESWDLLREKVFGEDTCHYQLEKVGKKIAENCEGLPLLILSVAKELSKSEKTLEYWNMVATGEKPIIMGAQIKTSEALVMSYENLPQHLKACFLYMGVFPQNHKISTSKLMKLWIAEEIFEPNPSKTLEETASRFLKELVDSNMVMVNTGSDLETSKTCYLHSVSWHLSYIEANKCKFFHTLKPNGDTSMEFAKRQWRLCIRHSILLRIENNAVAAFTSIRSLLCTGLPNQYPVPLCYDSKLLRVLEAHEIRFYDFPIEVVKLVQLRYLALTCDENLPPSISKLWNLQFLIVRQHLSIKSSYNHSYLPKEIWDMKELKHLHVSGSNLPDPENEALLPNLSSLLDVSVHSCTEKVFKGIPNLKKLGIQIELAPSDNSNPLHYLDQISHLSKLESLKCIVVNPDLGLEGVAPPIPSSMLPSSLRKLSLSGLGYSWEYMSIIGKLQNLQVLKLRCYACVGPSWEMDKNDFPELKFLSIEDTDLVRWDIRRANTYKLQFLSFKHCYNLEQLPHYLPERVKMIEVVDSHPSCENWAKMMKENNWGRRMETLEYRVQSSRNDLN